MCPNFARILALYLQQQQNPDGSWEWLIDDGLGSVRAVVDSTNTLKESKMYDPYGSATWTSGDPTHPQTVFGFTGQETDANGLLNLRARYYNPTIGQFFNLDPLEGDAGQPMSLNRYSYVQGNVINFSDPSGMVGESDLSLLNQYQPSCQIQDFQDPCIQVSRLTEVTFPGGSKSSVRKSKVKSDLYSQWGVVLTVQCGIPNETNIEWTQLQINNLTSAFADVQAMLTATTGHSFLGVFGGLEMRHVGDVGAGAGAITPVPQRGLLMEWSEVGRSTGIYKTNIIHELGHVLSYRSGSNDGNPLYPYSMEGIGNAFNLPAPETPGIGRLHERGSNNANSIRELVADHFLNLVEPDPSGYIKAISDAILRTQMVIPYTDANPGPSYQQNMITTYWLGGPFERIRNASNSVVYSPGIGIWTDLATFQAAIALINLHLP